MRKRFRLLAVAVALSAVTAIGVATPAKADNHSYIGVAESTFSCWTAASGNQYCAHIRSSIVFISYTIEIAYRVNIWCTVNGNPSNCEIKWSGGLKRYRHDLGPGFATYPWGTVGRSTGGGSSQVIWEGGLHGLNHDHVYQTVGQVYVRWVAPNHWSSVKTRCSDAMRYQPPSGGDWAEQWAGPLNCL